MIGRNTAVNARVNFMVVGKDVTEQTLVLLRNYEDNGVGIP